MTTQPLDKVSPIKFAKDCLKGLADLAYRQMQIQIERVRRVPESRVQHGAKKAEVKIRLPGRAVWNTEFRR
jgi:hypothetical protein